MNTEIATIVASVSTGARNIYEIATQMVNSRKTSKLITEGEIRLLEVRIQETIECARTASRHEIITEAHRNLLDSFNRLNEHDINSPFGLVALELFRNEALAYMGYAADFDRLTKFGVFK